MCRSYANSLLFYARDLNVHGFWCPWEVLEPIPCGYKRTTVVVSCLRACKRRKWNLNSSLTAVNSSFSLQLAWNELCREDVAHVAVTGFLPDFNLGGCISSSSCLSERLQRKHYDQLNNTEFFFFFFLTYNPFPDSVPWTFLNIWDQVQKLT